MSPRDGLVSRAATLADLLADPEVGLHLQAVPGAPALALVAAAAVDQVRAALEARGMTLDGRLLG